MKKNIVWVLFCFLAAFLQAGDCQDQVGDKRYREYDTRGSRKESRLMSSRDELSFLIRNEDSPRAIAKISGLINDNLISAEALQQVLNCVKAYKRRSSSPQNLNNLEDFLVMVVN